MPRCSVPIDQIGVVSEWIPATSLANLRHLSLTISHLETPDGDDEGLAYDETAAIGKMHADNVIRLLQQCPHLISLDLRWYKLQKLMDLSEAQVEEQHLFLA